MLASENIHSLIASGNVGMIIDITSEGIHVYAINRVNAAGVINIPCKCCHNNIIIGCNCSIIMDILARQQIGFLLRSDTSMIINAFAGI